MMLGGKIIFIVLSISTHVDISNGAALNASECTLQCTYPEELDPVSCQCRCTFVPHHDRARYYMPISTLTRSILQEMPCNDGLVWDQESCQCSHLPVNVLSNTKSVNPSSNNKACDASPYMCGEPFVLDQVSCKCRCGYPAHPSPNKFYVPAGAYAFEMPCGQGTLWDSLSCSCSQHVRDAETKATSRGDPETTGDCIELVKMTVQDNSLVDLTRNWLDTENKANITVVDLANATDGTAAVFVGNSITLPVFEYNDLTRTAQFDLRFKNFDDGQAPENQTQVLLSNACDKDPDPSLYLSFNPSENSFSLVLVTKVVSMGSCENATSDDNGWYDVSVIVEDSNTTLSVNGHACLNLTGVGAIRKTPCGMTIAGDPLAADDNSDFYGYLDYFNVKKHCATA